MDWTQQTVGKLNPQSSQDEIHEQVGNCYKLLKEELITTGMVGVTKPDNPEHGEEICYGLAVEAARKIVGSKVPAFQWNRERPARGLFLWEKGRFPYGFKVETHDDFKYRQQEFQRMQDRPWGIDTATLSQEVEDKLTNPPEEAEEEEWENFDGTTYEPPKESPGEKLRRGLQERDERRGGNRQSMEARRREQVEEKARREGLSEVSSTDKIKMGLRQRKEEIGLPVDE